MFCMCRCCFHRFYLGVRKRVIKFIQCDIHGETKPLQKEGARGKNAKEEEEEGKNFAQTRHKKAGNLTD